MDCRLKKAARLTGKYTLCFLVLLAVFVLLMTLVYMIPNSKIEWHREYSLYVLSDIEETWESFGNLFGLHSQPGMMDNTTDRIMITESMIGDESMSALEAAMYMNGYTRYWHGYQVFLRPLLVFYQLHQIRYMNMFVFFGLFCLVLCTLKRRTGTLSAVAFFLSMMCAHIVVIPMSMQYMAVSIVMMLSMLVILWRYPFKKIENVPLFFMASGMLISFLDFLTFPVAALGMPLLLCVYIDQRTPLKKRYALCNAFFSSCAWAAGYALCWASKWVLSAFVLKRSIFDQVADKVQHWAVNRDHAQGRVETVLKNFDDYFMMQGIRSMIFPLLFLFILLLGVLLFRRKERQVWIHSGIMVAVSLYPYAWYFVLMEHSWLHHWFTYRAQIVTLFGICMALIGLIDQNRMYMQLCRTKENLCPNGRNKA